MKIESSFGEIGRETARGRRSKRAGMAFFTIEDVAEIFGVVPRTVARWIKAKQLVAHRIGGVVRIAESDLKAFTAAHRAT